MNTSEVAEMAGVPLYEVLYEIKTKRIKAKKVENRWAIPKAEVDKYLAYLKILEGLTPLKKWLKRKRMTLNTFCSRRYRGIVPDGLIKINGRIYIDERKN